MAADTCACVGSITADATRSTFQALPAIIAPGSIRGRCCGASCAITATGGACEHREDGGPSRLETAPARQEKSCWAERDRQALRREFRPELQAEVWAHQNRTAARALRTEHAVYRRRSTHRAQASTPSTATCSFVGATRRLGDTVMARLDLTPGLNYEQQIQSTHRGQAYFGNTGP